MTKLQLVQLLDYLHAAYQRLLLAAALVCSRLAQGRVRLLVLIIGRVCIRIGVLLFTMHNHASRLHAARRV